MEVRRNGTKKGRSVGEANKSRHAARSPPSNTQSPAQDRPQTATSISQAQQAPPRENASTPTVPEASLSPRSAAARNPMQAFSLPLRPGEQPRAAKSPVLGDAPKPMTVLNFAVVGASGAGKSTFIKCALDLTKPASSPSSTKKMSLEGELFRITLMELQLDDVTVPQDRDIGWPEHLGSKLMPKVDGVLALYDVTDGSSVSDIPALMIEQTRGAIRPRALTASHSSRTPSTTATSHLQPKHSRAISEMTGSVSRPPQRPSLSGGPRSAVKIGTETASVSQGPLRESSVSGPASPHSRNTSNGGETLAELPADSSSTPSSPRGKRPSKIDLSHLKSSRNLVPTPLQTPTTVANSFLDREEEVEEAREAENAENRVDKELRNDGDEAEDINGQLGGEDDKGDIAPKGRTFEELVELLLQEQLSKSDKQFVAIFLCLYRKFAAPAELLAAIIRRYEAVDRLDEPQLVRRTSQLRQVGILARWVSEYPGDFAYPSTYKTANEFANKLAKNRVFAVASKEMIIYLDTVTEDDDTNWACSDLSRIQGHPSLQSPQIGNALSSPSPSRASTFPKHTKTPSSTSSTYTEGRSNSIPTSQSPSLTPATTNDPLTAALRHAPTLVPIPRTPLSKIQWHQFMDTPCEDTAKELTRIDRTMFLSIRPRDLVRHVSFSPVERLECKNLENVNRMINHFNHVAFWVANIILLRDKAKHRAKALERFMMLAWKLRQLNNYNALGAVVAGINGTAVHRLAQTRDLVAPQVQRDFMRLEILMGTAKSHFAYRLAWENTPGERIPFLPLHRRDLVSAEEGNKTFVGEGGGGSGETASGKSRSSGGETRINWRKFEIMGDVVVGMQRSQGMPWSGWGGKRDETVWRMVMEGRFSKDEDVS